MKFELLKLPYSYDALEPFIDAQTMEIHHSKHHQNYVNNLNAALEKYSDLQELTIEKLLDETTVLPSESKVAIRNNAGGVFNHNFFWSVLASDTQLTDQHLLSAINNQFGGVEKFKEEFTKSALGRFGSGWAWLVLNQKKELEIYSTANQDSPILEHKTPLLTLDVWEHAYYLKYQNRRSDYISNWWNIVNWDKVSELYNQNI